MSLARYLSKLAALVGSDGKVPAAGIADGAITTAKVGDAQVTQAKLATGVAGNGPAFSATLGSDQVLTSGTYTKLAFSVESLDTNSNYNTSLYRFTPTVAGYYQVNIGVISYSTDISQVILYKNGSGAFGAYPTLNQGVSFGSLVYLNGSTDYIELYCVLGANGTIRDIDFLTYFQGFLVRAA